jgi:hypothetical protein
MNLDAHVPSRRLMVVDNDHAASHDARFCASILKPADPERLLGLLARLPPHH